VLSVVTWILFALIAILVWSDPPTSVDHSIQKALGRVADRVAIQAGWPATVSGDLARLGSAPVLAVVIVLVGLYFWTRHRSLRPAALLGVAYAAVVVLTSAFKGAFHRPEPYDAAYEIGRSFPSGHSAGSVAVWGGLALLLWASPRLRPWSVALVSVPVVVAGMMIVRSAHWVSDVAAGASLGAACLATSGLVTGRRRRPASGRSTSLAWSRPTPLERSRTPLAERPT
jgi:undecaprenyl-diphosphatase